MPRSSTFPLLACVLLMGANAWASVPKFGEGGFSLQLSYGPGFFGFDETTLAQDTQGGDPGGAALFVDDLESSHTLGLSLAYSFFGHVSLGANITATGWRLTETSRGGAGFVVGSLAWHPMELVYFFLKQPRDLPFDFSTGFGVGWGIVGQSRGMDGLLFEWLLNAEYYFFRSFAVGAYLKGVFFNFDKYYLDYNNRDLPGATIELPRPSGGSFWTFGLTLTFRAGE